MDRDSDLLDIKQAAAFLQVSETSLRRWTNAGQLPCYRLGGRRERRFKRADLVAFLQRDHAGLSGAAGHICGLYQSDAARVRQATDFLADALQPHSLSLLVAAPKVRAAIVAQLKKRRPSVRDDIAAGRLVLSEYAASKDAQIVFWRSHLEAGLRAGARSLRVVGDVTGGRLAIRGSFDAVLEYESDYDRLIAQRFPVNTLCLYDARTLSGVDAAHVFRCHGDGFRYPVEHLVS